MTTRPHERAPGSSASASPGGAAGDTALIAARLDRIPPNRFHARLAGILGTGTFFDGFDAISIAVVLSAIVAYFDISIAQASFIISAGYLGQLIGALIIGALSERIGRRPAFVLCVITFGVLSLGAALSWSATSLLVFRLLQGMALGAEVPIAAVLMNEYLSSRKRGRIGLLYQSLFPWGLFFAPLTGFLLIETTGPESAWRYLFAIGALPAVVGIWAWFKLPESARWLAGKGRTIEADALVRQVEAAAARRGDDLDEPYVAAASLVGSRDFHPSEIFQGVYLRRTVMVWSAWFLASFINYGCAVWLPTLLIKLGGVSPSKSLFLTTAVCAISVVATLLGTLVIDRIGRKKLLIGSFATMMLGGLVGTLGVGVFSWSTLPVLVAAGAIIAIGAPLALGPLWIYTGELYPTRMRGWASSAASAMNRGASIVSPILMGAILTAGGGVSAVFSVLLVSAILGCVVLSWLGIETRNRALEDIAR
ncbi:MFS transporter [Rhodococcus koreensis]|uniref:MFS transporter n=1 Tax=Rhodococcus koreensis TaxID=99653 RepID=UPI00366CF222